MQICCIGRNFGGEGVLSFDLDDPRTLLDFDICLFDLEGLKGTDSTAAMRRRCNEVIEVLNLGRLIVAFVAEFPLDRLLPLKGVGTTPSLGKRIDFRGPDHLRAFWTEVSENMAYRACLTGPCGKEFLFVADTKKAVASWVQYNQGHILLLPSLPPRPSAYSSHHRSICNDFVQKLLLLKNQFSPTRGVFCLPAWSSDYSWPRERELRNKLQSIEHQAQQLKQQIEATTNDLIAEGDLKILFTSKGDVLVDALMKTFSELGVKPVPGESGRDDIIIEFEGKHAVVEVKGKKGSAAEADAAQLEKWVAGFKEQNGKDPKGILLINAYCETPLAERTDPAFPHQMLKYSMQREHCLMTTTQIIGVLFEARAHPEKRVDLVNGIFSTVGVYQQFLDWRTFLTASVGKTKSTEASRPSG